MVFSTKIETLWHLGLKNLDRVFSYRLSLRLGLNPVQRLSVSVVQGKYFSNVSSPKFALEANKNWYQNAKLFGKLSIALTEAPPPWHLNPLTGKSCRHTNLDWWQIPDFDPNIGDIKLVWELSRFDWVLAMAQRARQGDSAELQRLNVWLSDWVAQNPPYKGANWKCGQEASIRVMHLAVAALILDQVNTTSDALQNLLVLHLQRIAPTIGYAVAQDNNHGTSEAAALFIGGTWLQKYGHKKGKKWSELGRKWLENRARRLISGDGSFSQHSLNYHRLMLDTFSLVEVWRRNTNQPEMSESWKQRSRAATFWLFNMTNPYNGDGPNVGANDSARILQLTDSDCRDYRPSIQLAMVLFSKVKAYTDNEKLNTPLLWLGLEFPKEVLKPAKSCVMNQGGYCVLRRTQSMVMLRYPRFRFRPSQADAMHVDLWVKDQNLLSDAGTYSYNTDARWLKYFPGTQSHNTVQFDDRDQMPRLGRFLFGQWLKTQFFSGVLKSERGEKVTASYRDYAGASHSRSVVLGKNSLHVTDQLDGFKKKAVLRWRLQMDEWHLLDNELRNKRNTMRLNFRSNETLKKVSLGSGWRSLYYQDKEKTPVLEIEISKPSTIVTEFHWLP